MAVRAPTFEVTLGETFPDHTISNLNSRSLMPQHPIPPLLCSPQQLLAPNIPIIWLTHLVYSQSDGIPPAPGGQGLWLCSGLCPQLGQCLVHS